MNGALKIVTAVAGGYLAGRSRKGLLIVPMALAGWAAKKGVEDRLLSGPLGAVGKEVMQQVQASAGQVVTGRAERLSDALEGRTATLRTGEQAVGAAADAAQAGVSGAAGKTVETVRGGQSESGNGRWNDEAAPQSDEQEDAGADAGESGSRRPQQRPANAGRRGASGSAR